MRVIALHFCELFSQTRELFIRALDLLVCLREPFIGRAGSVTFGSGVEFIGVFLFRPMSSEGSRSTSRPHPVLSKEWPYHGESAVRRKNTGSHGAESGAAAQPTAASLFHLVKDAHAMT